MFLASAMVFRANSIEKNAEISADFNSKTSDCAIRSAEKAPTNTENISLSTSESKSPQISGEKWLKSIFKCKNSSKYCFPNQEKVCTKRFLRFMKDKMELFGPSNMTDRELRQALKKYKSTWGKIYNLNNEEYYFLGNPSEMETGISKLKSVSIKRLAPTKYRVDIDFVEGYKSTNEVILVPDGKAYKIDFIASETIYEYED